MKKVLIVGGFVFSFVLGGMFLSRIFGQETPATPVTPTGDKAQFGQQLYDSFNSVSEIVDDSIGFTYCLDNYKSFPVSYTRRKNASWDMADMGIASRTGDYNHNIAHSQFIDLNGDGLQDYIETNGYMGGASPLFISVFNFNSSPTGHRIRISESSYKSMPAKTTIRYDNGGSCVYLNNGKGFDLVYKCYATLQTQQNSLPTGAKDGYGNPIRGTDYQFLFYGDCADPTNPAINPF